MYGKIDTPLIPLGVFRQFTRRWQFLTVSLIFAVKGEATTAKMFGRDEARYTAYYLCQTSDTFATYSPGIVSILQLSKQLSPWCILRKPLAHF